MKDAMRVALVGFMGAGKSSVAKSLSELCSVPLFECDEELLAHCPYQSIAEVFEKEGEEYFRNLESETFLKILATSGSLIISPGAGIIEREENRKALKESGFTVVYLDTVFDEIEKRIGDPSTRPLFASRDAALNLYNKRKPIYEELADIIVPTENYSASTLAKFLYQALGAPKASHNTQILSVIGDPVCHSVSPRMHGDSYKKLGVLEQYLFLAERVRKASLAEYMSAFRENKSRKGLAVTIPHKESIIEYLDELSEDATGVGAVNTVVKEKDSRLIGFNTDWHGIINPIKARTDVKGKNCCVLGGGGTARSATFALKHSEGLVTVVNRTVEKADKIAKDFHVKSLALSKLQDLKEFDVIINTTSVGLNSQDSLFTREHFSSHAVVMDVVYSPRETVFLQEAKSAGCVTITGEEMFVEQGKAQFLLHSTFQAPDSSMKQFVESFIK